MGTFSAVCIDERGVEFEHGSGFPPVFEVVFSGFAAASGLGGQSGDSQNGALDPVFRFSAFIMASGANQAGVGAQQHRAGGLGAFGLHGCCGAERGDSDFYAGASGFRRGLSSRRGRGVVWSFGGSFVACFSNIFTQGNHRELRQGGLKCRCGCK